MVKKALSLAIFFTLSMLQAEDFINLSFKADSQNPILLAKTIDISLNELNSRVEFIDEFQAKNPFTYSLRIWRDKNLNLNSLKDELLKHGVKVKNFTKNNENFIFDLDADNIKLNLNPLKLGEDILVSKKGNGFFINVNGASKLKATTKNDSDWIALIKIYDKNLSYIGETREQKTSKNINIDIDKNAYYMLITDLIDINNIKGDLLLNFY